MKTMTLGRHQPRHQQKWDTSPPGCPAGSISARIYTEEGIVAVFTTPGDDRHRAFTNFDLFIHPFVYSATLPRHYHARWLRRLASNFAWQCRQKARSA